jgi:hypothetical protein
MRDGIQRTRDIALVALGLLSASALAAPVTGSPAADGWLVQGNSLQDGTYIRGTGGWSFDLYSNASTLGASDALVGGNWQIGDLVVGLGGEMTGQYIYWPNIVAKFGSSSATFSPSTVASPNGNGNGSFSSGMAGLGGVQVDYNYEFDGTVLRADQALLSGQLIKPDNVLYNDGTPLFSIVSRDQDFARVIALFDMSGGSDILQSFEVILNLSYLSDPARQGIVGSSGMPIVNGKADMAVQRFANEYTDAYGLLSPSAVPVPASFWLLVSALASFHLVQRSRNRVPD